MKIFLQLLTCLFIATLSGCKQDAADVPKDDFASNSTVGDSAMMLVINEGLFQRNNSTITQIFPKKNLTITDFYQAKTGLQLGDTGNDLKVYGNKIYIVVNVSSYIAILDKTTFRLLKQISLIDNNVPKQPRQICFFQDKAFISCFDGKVVVLDTNTLRRQPDLVAGRNPDGICVSGNRLFVANTGGLSAPNYDNTISIFNLPSLTYQAKVTVAPNPLVVWPGQDNFVYVYSKADYASTTATFSKVDGNTNNTVWTRTIPKSLIGGNQDTLIRLVDQATAPKLVRMSTVDDQEFSTDFPETKQLNNPYRLFYNSAGHEIWISDAKNYTTTGLVYRYDNNGQQLAKYPVGLIPGAMALIR